MAGICPSRFRGGLRKSVPAVHPLRRRGTNVVAAHRYVTSLRTADSVLATDNLKDSNNAVYVVENPGTRSNHKRVYSVSDLGSSFGTAGLKLPSSKAKGNLASYAHSRFARKVSSGYVDFDVPATPNLMIYFFTPHAYFPRLRQCWIGRHIPRSDVKWMGQILARLSPKQIREAFRAAGFSPQEIDGFTEIVRNRIAALEDL